MGSSLIEALASAVPLIVDKANLFTGRVPEEFNAMYYVHLLGINIIIYNIFTPNINLLPDGL